MTAIRARNAEIAAYLIDNNINTRAEVARFERRDDVSKELEAQRVMEQQAAEKAHSKKKAKKKTGKADKADQLSRDASVRDLGREASNKVTDVECYMLDAREIAQELGARDIVLLIDQKHGQLWRHEVPDKREVSKRVYSVVTFAHGMHYQKFVVSVFPH